VCACCRYQIPKTDFGSLLDRIDTPKPYRSAKSGWDEFGGEIHLHTLATIYGGGQWILLAAWLGWYWCEVEEKEKASQLRHWIEAQADEHGWLPEQVPVGLNNESMYPPWVQRWGPIASPLLWSHAQYLILCKFMQDDA
jgi:GH15 family glucan-1,4-alpha-glucosidase